MNCSCHSHNGFLTGRGIEAAQRTSLEGLLSRDEADRVDIVVSVSASDGDGDLFEMVPDSLIDQQHRRFLNGF